MRVAVIIFPDTVENLIPIAEAFLRFSPQLCLHRKSTIFIEIGKCREIYKEETFLARLKILMTRFGFSGKVAIGDSITEALLQLFYGTTSQNYLPLSSFHHYFDPFQSDLKSRITVDRMIDNLEQVGIQTVSEFMRIPTGEIPSRFGAAGLLIRARVLGEMEKGWPLWVPTEKISERAELYDNDQCQAVEPLLFYLKPILDRAFTRLWGRGLRASSLKLVLVLEKYSTVKEPMREWSMEFILPQTTARGTLPIIRERLERDLARKPLESAVLAVELHILQSVRGYSGQRHFFHSREDHDEALNAVLSQMAEGLGKNKVFRATIHEEAVPEKSWSREIEVQRAPPDLSDYIPTRPTRLLLRPEKIQMAKEMIFIRKRPYRILKWSVVEKIDTHWIDEHVDRSYYRVELEGKSPVWIFKCPKDDYYLHGYFG